ncbi:MAG: hypothetical protein ACRCTD_06515 [Beijerinckiaceae bacterium]
MTLGEWLDTVIRNDEGGRRAPQADTADTPRRNRRDERAPARYGRDERDFSDGSAGDRADPRPDRYRDDYSPDHAARNDRPARREPFRENPPRRREGIDRRTEQALQSVERWLKDSGARDSHQRDDATRDETNAHLTQALDMINRRLNGLDDRIASAGSVELGAIRETMERLEQRIDDVTEAALHAGQRGRDSFQEDLERRVADIGRRIEDMGRTQTGTMSAGSARLERLETMLEKMSRSLEERQAEAARTVMNGPRRRAQALSASTSLSDPLSQSNPLSHAVAEIRAHKLRLDSAQREAPPAPVYTGPSVHAISEQIEQAQERVFARVSPAFDTIRSEIAKLAGQIADVRRPPDMSGLRDELAALRHAVASVAHAQPEPQPALPDVLNEISARMQQEFAAMNRAVTEQVQASMAATDGRESRLAHLVPALDSLSQRLESAGSRMATDLRRDFQSAISDLRQAVAQQRPSISMEPVEAAIRDLSQRVEVIAANPAANPGVDSAILVRTNLELAEMRDMIAKAANPLAIDRIEKQIDTLAKRIDPMAAASGLVSRSDLDSLTKEIRHLARQFDPALALSAMDDKLRSLEDRISKRMESAQRFAGEAPGQISGADILMPDVSGIETLIQSLSDKIDAVRQPDSGLLQIEALQRQISQIASKIDRSDDSTHALMSIERAVSDLFAQIDGLRDTQRETAEIAARKAAELLADTFNRRPLPEPSLLERPASADAAPQMAALADEVTSLLQARESVDRKTQNTLEAVHGALEKIVGRLNTLETEVVSQARRPAEPHSDGLPVRAAIEAATQAASQMAAKPVSENTAPARGLESRIAGARPAQLAAAPAAPAAPALDPSVLAKPGSRRSQPVPPPPPEKPSRFAIKLPFMKSKAPAVETLPVDQPMAAAGAPAAEAALPGQATRMSSGDVPLEPGSGRPGADSDMGARLVAAARRAAQTAVSETADAKNPRKSAAAAKITGPETDGEAKSFLAQRKKPILLGLAAIVLTALSVNVVTGMLSPKPALVVSQQKATPAKDQQTILPAAIHTAPEAARETLPAPARQSAAEPLVTSDPVSVGSVVGEAGKPLDINPAGSLLNPAPLNPPAKQMPQTALPQPAAEATAQAAPAVAALAPSDLPAGLTSPTLKAAIQKGDSSALYEVGARLFDGRGIARDQKLAFSWFERAANAGLVPAQFRVGNMYEKGIGVARDLKQARLWYGRAADKGNAKATHNLGVIIAEGGDGKADYTVASDLFRRAAQFGIRDSQYNIAILLARGLGVGQSMTEAYTWFALAAAQGDEEAGRKRDEVAGRLSPEDLAAAKSAVASFKPLAQDALANDVPERTWDAPAAPAASGKPKTSARAGSNSRT